MELCKNYSNIGSWFITWENVSEYLINEAEEKNKDVLKAFKVCVFDFMTKLKEHKNKVRLGNKNMIHAPCLLSISCSVLV